MTKNRKCWQSSPVSPVFQSRHTLRMWKTALIIAIAGYTIMNTEIIIMGETTEREGCTLTLRHSKERFLCDGMKIWYSRGCGVGGRDDTVRYGKVRHESTTLNPLRGPHNSPSTLQSVSFFIRPRETTGEIRCRDYATETCIAVASW